MEYTFTPVTNAQPASAGGYTFTPVSKPEDASDTLSKIGSNAAKDLVGDVKGAGMLAAKVPGAISDAADLGKRLITGGSVMDSPYANDIKSELGMIKDALPHSENGQIVPGGVLSTAKDYITHPIDSFIAHPVNMPLDVMSTVAPVAKGLGIVGKAGEVADMAKAADTAGKIGDVGDSGMLRKFASATSGAAEGAFNQNHLDPDLLKTAPKTSDAVSMVHDAVNKDIPAMLSQPTADISQQINKGLKDVKGQYYNTIDSTAKGVQSMLDDLKDQASAAEDAVRSKLGLGESIAQGQNRIIQNGTGVPKPAQLLKDYKTVSQFNDAEPAKLKALLDIRRNIDQNLDFSASGKSLEPLSSPDERVLQNTRADITNQIHGLPGGQDIKAVDDQWHNALDVRRQLFNQFSSDDKASKAIEGLVNNERPSKSTVAGLQQLEQLTGRPIIAPLQEAAKPLQDTIDALNPHLKTPEATESLIHKTAVGAAPSQQTAALAHLDQVAGTNILPQAKQIAPLVDLKNKLSGSRFAEPGATENTLKSAFNDPQSHADLINHIQQLEQVTGKPIADTVNRALAAEQLREPFNSSKSTMMLRAGAPILAAKMGNVPLIGAVTTAVSPRLLAAGQSAIAKATNLVHSTEKSLHLGGMSAEKLAQAGEAGSVSRRAQDQQADYLLNALKKK